MKFLIVALITVSTSCMAQTDAKKPSITPTKKDMTTMPKSDSKIKELNALDKKPEDCDTKAKKPVEITPESISLSGQGGCSLEDAH